MKLLLVMLLMGLSAASSAVTIGIVNPKSVYGDPLELEIELYDLGAVSPNEIDIRMVPKREHKIPSTNEELFHDYKTGIYASKGIAWVSLRSSGVLSSGMVDLVIEFRWPGGKTFRRFQTKLIGKAKQPSNTGCPFESLRTKCIQN